ncbi:MAP kinase-activated protein kinase 2 (Fragment) [Seminavis robusta]|uniref:MAP kinase-activated protein kinase 2 n=1 Tax=Seminavis robusta TaxID=568900 RepID=A0A9N8DPC5_9STRA
MIAVQKSTPFSRTRRSLFGKSPRFADQYELGDLIKQGGSGSVYRAIKKNSTEKYAVKVIDRTKLSKQAEKEILREVDIMRELDGLEHTTKVVDFFVSRKHYRIVQQLAKGGDVQDWVIQNGAYQENEARVVAIKLLKTMQQYHDLGIAHRDIKLPNILLERADDNASVVIADWGFANRIRPGQPLTKACGTPSTIAPEVLADNPSYNQSVDLWGVGCIIYSLLSGHPPYKLRNGDYHALFSQIQQQGGYKSMECKRWANVSLEAKDFVRGLLQVDPEQRWTAGEALQTAWIAGQKDWRRQNTSSSLRGNQPQTAAAE